MSTHTATAYLVLKARRKTWGRPDEETGLRAIDDVRVVRSLQSRPAQLAKDEIAVKVRIQVPSDAFNPVMPDALIVVPTDLAMRGPIEVEAEDASEAGQ